MQAVDLFSGGGGAALGLRRAGVRCLAHVEWDKHACATLRAAESAGLIDGDIIEGDIRAVDWAPYVGIDLVWASPPCQAWSSAGQRKGVQDERNGWPWTWDAVDKIRPTWLICENVGGLLHHLSEGHPDRPQPVTQTGLFGATPEPVMVRDDSPNSDLCSRCYWDHIILPEARRRFAHVDWMLIDCADLGVPQHRERLILVCGPEPYRWPVPTHRDPAVVHAVGKPWVTVRQALGVGAGITIEHDSGAGFSERHGPRTPTSADDPSPSITAGSKGSGPRLILRERHPDATLDAPAGTVRSGGDGHSAPPMWLRTECTGAVATSIDAPSPSVTGPGNQYLHAGDPGVRAPRDSVRSDRRRLTPAECAALQSFPPDWPWQGTKTAIYRQIGNAVPPPLAEALAVQIVGATIGRRR